jgi:hypothetical protein
MLLQLSAASAVFLPGVPGESTTVQTAAEESKERVAADMSGRPFLHHCHAEEESRHHRPKEVHHQIEKRKWFVVWFWLIFLGSLGFFSINWNLFMHNY